MSKSTASLPKTPTGLDLDTLTTELWRIAKQDSLASSRIGSPSGDTRKAFKQALTRWGLEQRIAEDDYLMRLRDELGKFKIQDRMVVINRRSELKAELQANLQGEKK